MPVDEPQFGEVWATTDATSGRTMHGIIADVSPTRIMFVGLTGNRVAVPLSRLRMNWSFVQAAPRRTLPLCERTGCTNTGMIEYLRGLDRQEYVCPKHTPSNIQCRITTDYEPPKELRTPRPGFECRSTPCPSCGHADPAEDVRLAQHPVRLWFCPACNVRWVTIPIVLNLEQDIESLVTTVAGELTRWQFELDSVVILQPRSWAEFRRKSPTIFQDLSNVSEVIPRVTLRNGLQAFLDTTTMTEQTREHFHAIARVRSNVTRQADRPVQRLGGSPNRSGVVGSSANPVRPAPTATGILYRATGQTEIEAAAASLHRLRNETIATLELPNIETPVQDTPIEKESIWVQRATGDLVVVIDTLKAIDGLDVIAFSRNSADGIEPSVTMARRDFLIHHRAHTHSSEDVAPSKPMIEVSVQEEWECQDGTSLIITRVDFRKEIIYGDDMKTKKHRQIPFAQFALGRWRKIVRRSIYDRIRQPEINLAPGQDEK
jgi:hypothetical protein